MLQSGGIDWLTEGWPTESWTIEPTSMMNLQFDG
jgi:hypothetical protein